MLLFFLNTNVLMFGHCDTMCQFPKHLKHLMFLLLEEEDSLVEGNMLEVLEAIPSLRCVGESSFGYLSFQVEGLGLEDNFFHAIFLLSCCSTFMA